ncbi:Serpin-ZX [Heracleum sosnowskyi]|uniref:Serpin-ZX n=1 Tax=Heracleum sosnowskyi TaxID=360622 RepID=A0AAD8J4Q4_9APIA|nr:Serpin-ZX [Heracleum sosnowskyi]
MEITKSMENQTAVSMTLTKYLLEKSKDSNVVFSPLLLQLVLSLVAAGAQGQSLEELLSFLKAESPDELNSVASHLVKYLFVDDPPSDAKLRLSLANGVWIDKSISFKPFFSKVVDDVYQGASDVVDFENEANEAAKKVNSWVKKKTNGLVKDAISPGSLDHDTKIIFANAIYFKGFWANKFDMLKTSKNDFHLLDDSSVRVPFMTSYINYYRISAFDGFKVLELPYNTEADMRKVSMFFYLPDAKDGLSTLVDKLASEPGFIERHIPSDCERVGKLQIPKFKMSFGFEASEVLKELGVSAPFIRGRRDFDGMVNSQEIELLYVSSVFQKSYIEVNESGTEACAYTRARLSGGGAPPVTKIDFIADHPFLFLIRENKTGVVLFIGQVLNPLASWPPFYLDFGNSEKY